MLLWLNGSKSFHRNLPSQKLLKSNWYPLFSNLRICVHKVMNLVHIFGTKYSRFLLYANKKGWSIVALQRGCQKQTLIMESLLRLGLGIGIFQSFPYLTTGTMTSALLPDFFFRPKTMPNILRVVDGPACSLWSRARLPVQGATPLRNPGRRWVAVGWETPWLLLWGEM